MAGQQARASLPRVCFILSPELDLHTLGIYSYKQNMLERCARGTDSPKVRYGFCCR